MSVWALSTDRGHRRVFRNVKRKRTIGSTARRIRSENERLTEPAFAPIEVYDLTRLAVRNAAA